MTFWLKPAELAWRGVNHVRRELYRAGLLRQRRLPRPVISVGNIAAGGTGKTPAVIAIVRFLSGRGLRVAVLTRGYGRAAADGYDVVSSFDTDKFGDEPVLIRKSLQCEVIVGSCRYDNGLRYLGSNDCDCFLLDDGFQHLRLHRDFDLVIDAPARLFREGRGALRDADAVIPRRLRLDVPDDLRGRPLFAFAGLADNDQFFTALRDAGLDLAGTRGFPDHHRYTAADMERLRVEAAGAVLVTTAKDAVKIAGADLRVIDAEMEIPAAVLDRIGRAVDSATARTGRSGVEGGPELERRRKRRKNPIVQWLEYVLFRAVAGRVASMSIDSARRLGSRLGMLGSRVLRRRDRLAMRNLRHVYPARGEAALRNVLDECWRHFGREAVLSMRYQTLEPEVILRDVRVDGAHLIDEGLSLGNGVILLGAHWGSWEVAGLAAMSVVPRMRVVARPLDNELLERDIQRLRAKMGAEIVDRRRAARALLRGIAGNGIVGMIPDQAVQPREGILVPFLGRPAWTTPAPAKLALRSNAMIVFTFCIPEGSGYRLVFEEPIRTDLLRGDERDPVMLTRRINDVFARRIHERPELWLWMHDRWKGTEGSEASNVM